MNTNVTLALMELKGNYKFGVITKQELKANIEGIICFVKTFDIPERDELINELRKGYQELIK